MMRKHDQTWNLDIPIASFIETCRKFPEKELFTFEKEGQVLKFFPEIRFYIKYRLWAISY